MFGSGSTVHVVSTVRGNSIVIERSLNDDFSVNL
ncbi:hypothetical protein SLEP1_g27647 [Rubroshorea leprosula]|uniref:Uncharacterized protein n=1 Tax=Rubroshorea leprosula TaxID=152421 RepID=A0AAV5K0S5_9ROSI|nr:hypothetical protein SLEP1_g27647 [Rubroshorea leprosula]